MGVARFRIFWLDRRGRDAGNIKLGGQRGNVVLRWCKIVLINRLQDFMRTCHLPIWKSECSRLVLLHGVTIVFTFVPFQGSTGTARHARHVLTRHVRHGAAFWASTGTLRSGATCHVSDGALCTGTARNVLNRHVVIGMAQHVVLQRSRISDPGFWIQDLFSRIPDSGSWF